MINVIVSLWQTLPIQWRCFLTIVLAALPALALVVFSAVVGFANCYQWLLLLCVCLLWLGIVAYLVSDNVIFHIRNLNTLTEAIQAGDYSLRGTRARGNGELPQLYDLINALANQLQSSQERQTELQSLVDKVIAQIDVAIIAYNAQQEIVLLNQRASTLLAATDTEKILGQLLQQTPLAELPEQYGETIVDHQFSNVAGRWQVNRQKYHVDGKEGGLLFITDLSNAMAENELQAWRRLIRVISHEVNNSLTPILSICETVSSSLTNVPDGEDLQEGLSVVIERSKGLKQFISGYSQIARLPEPDRGWYLLSELIESSLQLYSDAQVICEGANERLYVDKEQFQQLFINLLKNAIEASSSNPRIDVVCQKKTDCVEINVIDQGQGIANPENLFIPFYSTKEKGAGIGLVLARQIAARHGGSLTLANRIDGKGAMATVSLPRG